VILARIARDTFKPRYLAVDAPLRDAEWAQALRVRFQVQNADSVAIMLTPRLEYRRAEHGRYAPVPRDGPHLGTGFYVGREWVRPPKLKGGSRLGPGEAAIAPGDFRIGGADAAGRTAVEGIRLMGASAPDPVSLPPGSVTEVEFSVRVTMDARHSAAYELRLADGDAPLPAGAVARIQMGPAPPPALSPRQRKGVAVAAPAGAGRYREAAVRYPLVKRAPATTKASPVRTANEIAFANPHGPFSTTTDQCAACHRGHTAQSANLLPQAGPQSNLCLTCHDGTGATTNVTSQYTDPAVPANNPAAREYYRHDALVASSHTRSDLDEFGGVMNRHSECGDCHNAHRATGTGSTETAGGWTAGGRLDGVSGVSVANGPAGTAPTYMFLNGGTQPVTLEYQLCLKCHSGFTTLPSNSGFTPSKYVLDKGVELNPANGSYHPVEAAGTNATQKMTDSLAGTSPYKLWTFTVGSTIRCTNCHVSSTKYDQATPQYDQATPQYDQATPPVAGSDLPPHTSQYRSMLVQNYRDRLLKSAEEGYAAADFALCYACHAEAPFANETSTATNFPLHGLHVGGLAGKGAGGTDIDTPGAGQGNAICAECHFRIHSTAYPYGTQAVSGARLVNFAPNVQPYNGVLSWTGGTGGSCTLTCHGKGHDNYGE
jgi:predicted CXXCH cytochrome family protein